jgi:hypothetical protein
MISNIKHRHPQSISHLPQLLDPPHSELDPSVMTIRISTKGIDALYKVSSLSDRSSWWRDEHKLFNTLHPS